MIKCDIIIEFHSSLFFKEKKITENPETTKTFFPQMMNEFGNNN